MNLSAAERDEIAAFRVSPAAQGELRSFMAQQGADFGRELRGVVARELSARVLLSNSGRVAAGDILRDQLGKQAARLRTIGHDDVGVETYIAAARAELAYLGA